MYGPTFDGPRHDSWQCGGGGGGIRHVRKYFDDGLPVGGRGGDVPTPGGPIVHGDTP